MHQPDQDVLEPYLISEATLRKAWELRGMQDWGQSGSHLGSGCWPGVKGVAPLHAFPPCLLPLPSSSSHSTSSPSTSSRKSPDLSSSASVSMSLSLSSSLSLCFYQPGLFHFSSISNPFLPRPLPGTEWLREHVSSGLSILPALAASADALHASVSNPGH